MPPDPPKRDLLELVARLRLKSSTPLLPLARSETSYSVGRVEDFFVLDFTTLRPKPIQAVLRHVSPRAYFYVEEGVSVSDEALERSAMELEDQIIPAIHRYINPGWDPGAGIDSRITVLHVRLTGVAGYVDALDLFSAEVSPTSNQRPIVYMNVFAVPPGSRHYYAVLAHEMQHAAHAQADPQEEVWVQEGSSELLADLAGYPVTNFPEFLSRPDTQLTAWAVLGGSTLPHYGASHLFLKYIGARYGYDDFPTLVASRETGIQGVEAFLDAVGAEGGFDAAFRDWTIANILESPPESPFSYPGGRIRVALAGVVTNPGNYMGRVGQYAADYVDLSTGEQTLRVTFQGPTTAPLLPVEPPSGTHLWWSNRADQIDTTLTRRFDLSAVTEATLTFKLWHDIEESFDYAYVEASQDGGETWDILPGRHTTDENPLGQSFGPAYTGNSGGGSTSRWLDESINLDDYTGGEILVRFEYVTDEGINNPGLAIDDISIPEIGFFDDAEGDVAWTANGFFRTNNRVPQSFIVNILILGEEPDIIEMPMDAQNRGELVLPQRQSMVLVIGAIAPVTTEPTEYSYLVEAVATSGSG